MTRKTDSSLENMVSRDYQKVIVLPDAHYPYQDELTMKTVLHFIKDQAPDIVVSIGDWVDMYSISKYDKNPERAGRLQEELDIAHNGFMDVRKAAGTAPIIYVKGNHEDRLQKYLWRHPEIHGLRALDLKELLGLKEAGVKLVDEFLWKNTFLFTHGRRCGIYAARQELDDNGISGMSGHTHKLMSYAKKDRSGEKAWYTIGHIADETKAEYTNNPNWQQAIGLVHFHKIKSRFFALAIPITEHKFMYDGKIYHPDGITKLERR